MKLADVEIDELVRVLQKVRSGWINVANEERRLHTEAEKVTICILAALEQTLGHLTSYEG